MHLLITAIFFALGAVLGSFVGVIVERAYTGQSWKKGRSRCNSCRKPLTARDLLPILSWTFHRGRCRQCGSNVPGLYALYELTLGILFALSYLRFGISLQLVLFLMTLFVLAFIVIYDLRHTIVPPPASLALLVCAVAFALSSAPSVNALAHTFFYAGCIGLFFFVLYAGSRGRAMGLGDTPASFALALIAGSAAVPGFLFSFWAGGVIGVCILAFRKGGPTMGIEVPFVPFLAFGFLLALFTQWNPLPFIF